eukprot:6490920-Amphidinium_carterae.7
MIVQHWLVWCVCDLLSAEYVAHDAYTGVHKSLVDTVTAEDHIADRDAGSGIAHRGCHTLSDRGKQSA